MIKQAIIIIVFAFTSFYYFTSMKERHQDPLYPEIHKATEKEILVAKDWPIWSKEESEFDYSYDKTEQCLILEGEVDIIVGKNIYSFSKGDFVTFPKGLNCIWKIKKAVKKHYNFI